MSWSSGKDSAYALHTVRSESEVGVIGLLTTVNSASDRVTMHAVRRGLLEAQAAALGLPLYAVELPSPCSNDVYEHRMEQAMTMAVETGARRRCSATCS